MRINYKNLLNAKTLRRVLNSPKELFIVLVFLLVALFVKEVLANSQSFEAKVLKVVDGDTINVLSKGKKLKIRLFGIDAPESKQEFGTQSRIFLQNKILNKAVKLDCKNKDMYERLLCRVEFKGEDINKLMVKSGYAWAYSHYSDIYVEDQSYAKKQKLGLWKGKNPVEPYKWRKQNKF